MCSANTYFLMIFAKDRAWWEECPHKSACKLITNCSFFLQMPRSRNRWHSVMFQELYCSHQLPHCQIKANGQITANERQPATNHFNTSADHSYPTASFLCQSPHKTTFFFSYACSFMYKAQLTPLSLREMQFHIISSFMQLTGAYNAH